jgi:ElaB/YqjD/DUF883 family membrane-anchored ribosome-binding protein
MNTTNPNQANFGHEGSNVNKKTGIGHAASDLLHEGKKLANDLYEEGVNRVNDAEDQIKKYADELLQKVQEKPMSAILIAAGVGFLLAKMMKK